MGGFWTLAWKGLGGLVSNGLRATTKDRKGKIIHFLSETAVGTMNKPVVLLVVETKLSRLTRLECSPRRDCTIFGFVPVALDELEVPGGIGLLPSSADKPPISNGFGDVTPAIEIGPFHILMMLNKVNLLPLLELFPALAESIPPSGPPVSISDRNMSNSSN